MIPFKHYPVGTGYSKELVQESAKDALETLSKLVDDLKFRWKLPSTAAAEPSEMNDKKASDKILKAEKAIFEIKQIHKRVEESNPEMTEKELCNAIHRIATLRCGIIYGD